MGLLGKVVHLSISQHRIQLQSTKQGTLLMTRYLVKIGHLVPWEEQIKHIQSGSSLEIESFVTSISTKPGGICEIDIGEFKIP